MAEYAFCNNPTECQGYECSHSLSSNEQGTDRASSFPRQLCYSRPKVLSWSQTETKNGSHQAKAFREANVPIVSDGETCWQGPSWIGNHEVQNNAAVRSRATWEERTNSRLNSWWSWATTSRWELDEDWQGILRWHVETRARPAYTLQFHAFRRAFREKKGYAQVVQSVAGSEAVEHQN